MGISHSPIQDTGLRVRVVLRWAQSGRGAGGQRWPRAPTAIPPGALMGAVPGGLRGVTEWVSEWLSVWLNEWLTECVRSRGSAAGAPPGAAQPPPGAAERSPCPARAGRGSCGAACARCSARWQPEVRDSQSHRRDQRLRNAGVWQHTAEGRAHAGGAAAAAAAPPPWRAPQSQPARLREPGKPRASHSPTVSLQHRGQRSEEHTAALPPAGGGESLCFVGEALIYLITH